MDLRLALWVRRGSNLGDDATAAADIGLEGGPSGAVDDTAAADEQVVLHHLRLPVCALYKGTSYDIHDPPATVTSAT